MTPLKPNPNALKYDFKQKFIDRYSQLTDFKVFKKYSSAYLRRCIRVNTLKCSVADLKKRISDDWKLDKVPWCKEGFWIEHKAKKEEEKRRDIGNLKEHMLGYIYVQEAASMIPPLVLKPKPGDFVLDLCAAPGSKTTQMSQYMRNKGLVVVNDVSHIRLASLGVNTQRCGCLNVVMTQMKGHWFAKKNVLFDKILVDAPCSGTGTIRKSLKTITDWNPGLIRKMAGQQKQLLKTAIEITKQGGMIVYSTCSLEPEEDEGIVDYALNKFDNIKLKMVSLEKIKTSKPVEEFEGKRYTSEVKKCLRIWPQDNDTEGFFVAKFEKI